MRAPSDGVAPGWRIIIDAEDPGGPVVVVDRAELRVIQFVHEMNQISDGVLCACLERVSRQVNYYEFEYSDELEFNLKGWTVTHKDAAAWLRGEEPETFVVEGINMGTMWGQQQ